MRSAREPLVDDLGSDAEFLEQLEQLFKAPARQSQVLGKVFCATDHPRLAEGRKTHRLRPVELRILKGAKTDEPIQQGRRQPLLLNKEKVASDNANLGWQRSFDGRLITFARGRRGSRVSLLLSGNCEPRSHRLAGPVLSRRTRFG